MEQVVVQEGRYLLLVVIGLPQEEVEVEQEVVARSWLEVMEEMALLVVGQAAVKKMMVLSVRFKRDNSSIIWPTTRSTPLIMRK